MYILIKAILMSVVNFIAYHMGCSLLNIIYIYNRHFLPYGRTDLATTASLQPTSGGSLLQLHGPLLRSSGNLDLWIVQKKSGGEGG